MSSDAVASPPTDAATALLMAFMPLSVLTSLAAIALWPHPGFGYLAVVSGIYWMWAWKNRLLGPIKNDGGIVSFLPGLVVGTGSCASLELRMNAWWNAFAVASTLLPLAHFLGAASGMQKHLPTAEKLANKYHKPRAWALVFRPYLWAMCIVWLASAVQGVRTADMGAGKVLIVGGAMSAVLIPVAQAVGEAINRRTHPKAQAKAR